MSQPTCQHCAAGVQLFKWCRNLSAGTVLQRCSCLSCVETYLQGTVLQLFKWCCNLSASTVMQGCTCLSGVETYLSALCCRGAAVKVVSKPICQDCVAEVQLFKWCLNLSAGTVLQRCSCLRVSEPICWHCVAEVQLLKWCRNPYAGTVLQRYSCLSGVETYLLALCCRGAPV